MGGHQRIDGSLVGIFTIAESIGTELLLQGMHAHVSPHTTRDRFYLKRCIAYEVDEEAATL
jgi:hypothetical protein